MFRQWNLVQQHQKSMKYGWSIITQTDDDDGDPDSRTHHPSLSIYLSLSLSNKLWSNKHSTWHPSTIELFETRYAAVSIESVSVRDNQIRFDTADVFELFLMSNFKSSKDFKRNHRGIEIDYKPRRCDFYWSSFSSSQKKIVERDRICVQLKKW